MWLGKRHGNYIEFVSVNDAFGKENLQMTQMVWEFKFCEWNSGVFFPHPNNRQKSHFALKVSDMMGGWQRMLEMVLEICSNKNEKRNYEAENLSWSRLLRPCPFRVSFSLKKKPCSNPEKIVMWRTIPTKRTFPCKFIQNEKTQPETNQRTNPPNCNHHHHRNVCPRCQEDQADRWSGKNAAPTFLERSQLGHSWWFFWENPGQKGGFWNIGIPTLVTFSLILFAQNFDSQLSRGRSSPSCCEWKRAKGSYTPGIFRGIK